MYLLWTKAYHELFPKMIYSVYAIGFALLAAVRLVASSLYEMFRLTIIIKRYIIGVITDKQL
jgi:hypothetical protein